MNAVMNAFLAKIITAFLIFGISSCSFLNSKTVSITIGSYPTGAQIYVDDIYYEKTPAQINLVPDKTHYLKLIKDGYQPLYQELTTKFSMRKGRDGAAKRCVFDLLTTVTLIQMVGIQSVYCSDFVKRSYDLELIKIPENSEQIIQQTPQFTSQNYYIQNQDPQRANGNYQQPLFNSHSEFVNDGNDMSAESQNFNRSSRVDYYNWQ